MQREMAKGGIVKFSPIEMVYTVVTCRLFFILYLYMFHFALFLQNEKSAEST